MYKSYVMPIFDYCCHIWDNCTNDENLLLERLNLDALRTICGAVRGTSHDKLYFETNFKPLIERRRNIKLINIYKMYNHLAPDYLCDLVPQNVSENSQYNLRNSSKIKTINCRTKLYDKSFLPDTIKMWNSLPDHITNANTIGEFKSLLTRVQTVSYLDLNYGSRFCQIVYSRLKFGCR